MAYYQEDEVHRLITNMRQWSGDGAPIRSAASVWDSIRREVRRSWRSSFTLPTLGIDVTPATEALEAIGATMAQALVAFHTSSLSFEQQAREICHCAKSTYHTRLDMAHVLFMNAYGEKKQEQQARMHARSSPGVAN